MLSLRCVASGFVNVINELIVGLLQMFTLLVHHCMFYNTLQRSFRHIIVKHVVLKLSAATFAALR